jgi:cobalt-zinc-cadmium resistance protein CzcA
MTAYLPLFSFERAEARLFTPMAYTMGYALFGALLSTLALVPGLAYYAFRKPGRVYHNRWLEWLTHRYESAPRDPEIPRSLVCRDADRSQ